SGGGASTGASTTGGGSSLHPRGPTRARADSALSDRKRARNMGADLVRRRRRWRACSGAIRNAEPAPEPEDPDEVLDPSCDLRHLMAAIVTAPPVADVP